MVNGIYGYSGQDIYRQQAQKRAAEWAQRSAAQLQAAQGQQAGQVQYAQQPQQGYVQYAQPTQQVQQPEGCTDGKDDGKIGFWQGLKSFGKGALKFVGGLVGFDENGNWSAGKLIKNVAIGAGIFAIGVLTGGTAIIIGAGVATAGAGLVKSQYQFWTAKTDADAKAAMEGTGSNALALGLALTGAKGVMSKVNPTKNYNGFTGTLRAGWDSTTIGFKQGWNGIKAGYQAYKAGGWNTLQNTVVQSAKSFKNTVVSNYKNATKLPTVEGNQTARVKQYEDKIANLEEQLKNATDKVEKRTLQKQINRLNSQKANAEQAFNEINTQTKFDDAQAKLLEVKAEMSRLKYESEMNAGTLRGAKADVQLAQLEQKANIYENVIGQKTTQARNIRARIDEIQKIKVKDRTPEQVAELARLRQQRKDLNFDIPKRKDYEALAKTNNEASEALIKQQQSYDKALKEYQAAEKAKNQFSAGDPSDEAMLAQTKYYNAKNNLQNEYDSLELLKALNETAGAYKSAASGADYAGVIIPKAGRFFQTFNNQYGTTKIPFISGRKIPFTKYTVPSINNGWTIPATNEFVNSSVGGPSLDDIVLKELQYEQIAQTKSQLMQQGYTEAQATALINELMNGGGAAQTATAQAQATPQFGQYTTGQVPMSMNLQNLEYTMKGMGIVA